MKTDVLIVGGGPAGSAMAMFLVKEGIKPVILEAETFPRYHIGESLTGAGGKVLRELGIEAEMYRRQYPTKQGVKVYGNSPRGSWWVPVTGRDEEWKLFPWDTWSYRRSDFDKMMLDEAVSRGASLLRGQAIKPLLTADGAVRGVQASLDGRVEDIECEMLLDCTGQATFLANAGVTGPKYLGAYDKQIAIFSQVAHAIRDDGGSRETHPDNTIILYQQKFHWAWFIPLDREVVSVGVVIPSQYFIDKGESKRDFLLRELHELNPELKRRLPEIELVEDVHVIPNYSYQVRKFCGPGFACIGDSHRFVDPIFSFGMTVGMREGQFAAPLVRQYLEGKGRNGSNLFAQHQLLCEQGIDALEDMIDLFWEKPFSFAFFVHHRYKEDMTDLFATRMYERIASPPTLMAREMMGRAEERERSYQHDDIYSMPIGSRFHPERAPLWEPNSPVETTEKWMGNR